jgi:hypothetical protein
MAKLDSFHEDFTREEKIEGSSDRNFGFVFAAFFAILCTLAVWRDNPRWIWWAGLAAATFIIALVRPNLLKPLNRLWTMLGLFLFRIVSPIALGIIYFCVMTPMGFFIRWQKKDILRRKCDPQATSYWIPRDPPGPEPETMKNQF